MSWSKKQIVAGLFVGWLVWNHGVKPLYGIYQRYQVLTEAYETNMGKLLATADQNNDGAISDIERTLMHQAVDDLTTPEDSRTLAEIQRSTFPWLELFPPYEGVKTVNRLRKAEDLIRDGHYRVPHVEEPKAILSDL